MDNKDTQRPWRTKDDVRHWLGVLDGRIARECSNGVPLSEYLAALRNVERSPCTTVWKAGSFAYRCRECQVTESSAICVDCFKAGPHVNHDYVMYRSASGGCCDCGDSVSLKEEGFCSRHAHGEQPSKVLPESTQKVFENIVALLLAQLLRKIVALEEGKTDDISKGAKLILQWLQQVCSIRALREVVCREMLRDDPDAGRSSEAESGPSKPLSVLLRNFVRVPSLAEEETTLFLLMLYSHQFKESFSRELLHNYADWVLASINDEERFKLLDSCLDRVMVQLINVESITLELIKQERLLDCFVNVLRDLIKKAVDPDTSRLNLNHPVIVNKLYTRPLSDLRLIITHNEVGLYILRERQDLLHDFLKILESLQDMYRVPRFNFRDLDEDLGWMHAIAMEVYMTSIISQLVGGCYALQEAPVTPDAVKASVFPSLLSAARQTQDMLLAFYATSFAQALHFASSFQGLCMSLHIPLHRAFGMILAKLLQGSTSAAADRQQVARACLQDLAETQANLQEGEGNRVGSQAGQIMEYPLRVLFWMGEIRAREWRHQGEDLARLERVYTSSYWQEQSLDMDVLVMQYCIALSAKHPTKLLTRMLERYKVMELLTSEQRPSAEVGGSTPVLTSALLGRVLEFLWLLLLLVRERRHVGMSEMELLRYEVIQWLCYKDMTYTKLTNSLPISLSAHSRLEEVLHDVAMYAVPKLQERGFYRLKPECWREFDMLFLHFSKGELEEALLRAVDIGKVGPYWRLPPLKSAPPPFDALCNILHSQMFHHFLYVALDQSLQLLEADTNSTVGEALAMVASQLIATAALDDRHGSRNRRHKSCKPNKLVRCWPFIDFTSNDVAINVQKGAGTQGDGPSILDLFTRIRKATNSSRLLDCIQYVLETTNTLGVNTGKAEVVQAPPEASSPSPDAESRRKLKKQRQAAILADFAARQKAFLKDETPGLPEEAGPSVTAAAFGAGTALEDSSPRVGETLRQEAGPSGRAREAARTQECAFCLGDQEMNESPMGWIAFIQRSNIAAVCHRQLQPVQDLREAEALASRGKDAQGSGPLLCAVPAWEGGGSVQKGRPNHAYETGEHVGCCGHQMHLECFQQYLASLSNSHNSGRTYEGFGLINLAKVEFLCPICRRLANFILPDAESTLSLAEALPGASDGLSPSAPATAFSEVLGNLHQSEPFRARNFWRLKYGRQHERVKEGCQLFVGQCQDVRGIDDQSREAADDSLSGATLWEELWSILAANIVQCEIETRGSPSTAPRIIPPDNVAGGLLQLWGGASAHWRALRALSGLAVLSTTSSSQLVLDVRTAALTQWQTELGEPKRSESGSKARGGAAKGSPVLAGFGEPSGPLAEGGDNSRDRVSRRGQEGRGMTDDLPGMLMLLRDGSGQRGVGSGVVGRSAERDMSTGGVDEGKEQGALQEGSALANDPFAVLIFLFMTHVGPPSHSAALAMVTAAYHIATAQAYLAADAVRAEHPDAQSLDAVPMSVVQAALVPFLRKAAMLVQVVSGQLPPASGLDTSDGDLMEYGYWRQCFSLPAIPVVLQTMGLAALIGPGTLRDAQHQRQALPRQLLLQGRVQLKLVDLPDVFQELLLAEMNHKCDRCGTVPREPAFCLMCGTLVCCKSTCCHVAGKGECSSHAMTCGMGIGIFLLLRSTQMLILRGDRACMAPSIYLDVHGEEDVFLKRGRPLRLSRLRYDEIERMWLTGGLDQNSQLLHSSHLGSESL